MDNEMRYRVHVWTPNRIFNIHGKTVRSPFEYIATENDLNLFKLKLREGSHIEYTISIESTNTNSVPPISINEPVNNSIPPILNDSTAVVDITINDLKAKSKRIMKKIKTNNPTKNRKG